MHLVSEIRSEVFCSLLLYMLCCRVTGGDTSLYFAGSCSIEETLFPLLNISIGTYDAIFTDTCQILLVQDTLHTPILNPCIYIYMDIQQREAYMPPSAIYGRPQITDHLARSDYRLMQVLQAPAITLPGGINNYTIH